jgi:hypothetical protein
MVKEIIQLSLEEFRALPQVDRNEVLQDLRDLRDQLRSESGKDLGKDQGVGVETPPVYFTYN